MSFVNHKEVRVVALSRSGIHAFVEWVLAQAEGPYLFLNSAEGKADPFATARPMQNGRERGWRSDDPAYHEAAPDEVRHRARDLLMVSYEDSFLSHALSPWYEEHHDRLVGASRERLDIVLVRDPFNLFASRLHSGVGEVSPEAALRVWRQHARAETVRPRRPLARRPLVVSYNRWCGDRDYREQVAEVIGIPFTDEGRSRVPDTFGGSSFDGTAFDGRADKMRVFERWRRMKDEPHYRDLFDEATVELALRRFGEGPGGDEVRAAAAALTDRLPTARTAAATATGPNRSPAKAL